MTTGWAHHRPTCTAHALRDRPTEHPQVRTWCNQVLSTSDVAPFSADTTGAPVCIPCLAGAPLPYAPAELPRTPTPVRPAPARPPGAGVLPEGGRA